MISDSITIVKKSCITCLLSKAYKYRFPFEYEIILPIFIKCFKSIYIFFVNCPTENFQMIGNTEYQYYIIINSDMFICFPAII